MRVKPDLTPDSAEEGGEMGAARTVVDSRNATVRALVPELAHGLLTSDGNSASDSLALVLTDDEGRAHAGRWNREFR
eukprot:504775-Prorocentrum_minimum.AAC.1